jgi:four helix bundle protein
LQFLNFAKGSAGEVRSLLRVALEVGYLGVAVYDELKNAAAKLSASLYNQMKALRNFRK